MSSPFQFIKFKKNMKASLKNILVPIDLKESSLNALRYAIDIAKRINGNIFLLHVIRTGDFWTRFLQDNNEFVKIIEKAKEDLDKIAEEYSKQYDVNIETSVEGGKPYKIILEISNKLKARFIVIGDNDYPTPVKEELGSTIYHVVINSCIPVITVKGNKKRSIGDKVLVPLDLTVRSSKQVFSALALGINYKISIYLVSALIGGVKIAKSRIYKKLRVVQKTMQDNNIPCTYKLYERSEVAPHQRVLEYAKEIDADLILIMTHQEGFTHDNYIGAFAHHIINQSDRPVLSLTSTACEIKQDELMKNVVDPLGIFLGKPGRMKWFGGHEL
ncbi:MAG: universal stress protein [Bacteroidota bacterium]